MHTVCAYSEIRRMPKTIDVIFTTIIHYYVQGIDPLLLRKRDQSFM